MRALAITCLLAAAACDPVAPLTPTEGEGEGDGDVGGEGEGDVGGEGEGDVVGEGEGEGDVGGEGEGDVDLTFPTECAPFSIGAPPPSTHAFAAACDAGGTCHLDVNAALVDVAVRVPNDINVPDPSTLVLQNDAAVAGLVVGSDRVARGRVPAGTYDVSLNHNFRVQTGLVVTGAPGTITLSPQQSQVSFALRLGGVEWAAAPVTCALGSILVDDVDTHVVSSINLSTPFPANGVADLLCSNGAFFATIPNVTRAKLESGVLDASFVEGRVILPSAIGGDDGLGSDGSGFTDDGIVVVRSAGSALTYHAVAGERFAHVASLAPREVFELDARVPSGGGDVRVPLFTTPAANVGTLLGVGFDLRECGVDPCDVPLCRPLFDPSNNRVLVATPNDVVPHLVDRRTVHVHGVAAAFTGRDAQSFSATQFGLHSYSADVAAGADDVDIEIDDGPLLPELGRFDDDTSFVGFCEDSIAPADDITLDAAVVVDVRLTGGDTDGSMRATWAHGDLAFDLDSVVPADTPLSQYRGAANASLPLHAGDNTIVFDVDAGTNAVRLLRRIHV